MRKKSSGVILIMSLLMVLLLSFSFLSLGCPSTSTTNSTTPSTSTNSSSTSTNSSSTSTNSSSTSTQVKTVINIGMSTSLTGANASIRASAFYPVYTAWVAQVNAAGGLNVGGQMMTINVIPIDDQSNVNIMTQNLQKLITQEHVDFIFPPCSTAFAYAAAPIANDYHYILSTAEAGATTMEQLLPSLPYVFVNLNYSDWNQLPVLGQELVSLGVQTVYINWIGDLFGSEYSSNAAIEWSSLGLQIIGSQEIDPTVTDFSTYVQAAKASGADAYLSFCYPPQNLGITAEMITQDYNPNFFLTGPGANFGFYHSTDAGGFGDAVNGVSCFASWSPKLSTAMADLANTLYPAGTPEAAQDWWGACYYWAGLQIFQQAIVETGSLDQTAIANTMQTGTFDTVLSSTTRYTTDADVAAGTAPCRGLIDKADQPAEIGQWQQQADGTYDIELVAGNNVTASPIYPKPHWPGQ